MSKKCSCKFCTVTMPFYRRTLAKLDDVDKVIFENLLCDYCDLTCQVDHLKFKNMRIEECDFCGMGAGFADIIIGDNEILCKKCSVKFYGQINCSEKSN